MNGSMIKLKAEIVVNSNSVQAPVLGLNANDENNILHLMGLTGLARGNCIEAYIACNKNVEMAANLLLDDQ